MNLPRTLNPLTALVSPQTGAPNAARQQPATAFNQVLSREVSQRPVAPEASKAPTPAKQQAADKQKAAEKQKSAEAPKSDEATPAQAAAPAAEATKAEDKAEAKDADNALSDIPGAPQAALIMNLMGLAPVATDKPAEAVAPDVDGAGAALLDPRERPAIGNEAAELRVARDVAAKSKGSADADMPDLRSFGKALGEAGDARAAKEVAFSKTEILTALTASAAESVVEAPVSTQAAIASLQAAPGMQGPAGHTDKLTPAVGSPAWDQALGQKIVWMAKGGEQTALLTMNPADLGPMQVVLSVTNDQATVSFSAAQPEVRQALENALPRLQEMMKESGIQLGQANVNAGGQQQFAGFEGAAGDRNPNRRGSGTDGSAPGEEAPRLRESVVRMARNGAVDTFA